MPNHPKSISSVLGGTLHHSERVDQLAELLQGTVTTCDHYGISLVGFWPCTEMPRRNCRNWKATLVHILGLHRSSIDHPSSVSSLEPGLKIKPFTTACQLSI